jgi:aminobenzoyl-glutamate utilization protein B
LAEAIKQFALDWISKHESLVIDVSDKIWEYAEVGLQEFKSSKLLADTLEKHGFKVERGVAGMPTAFVATYGSDRPIIGILGEYDAMPGLSQKAVPYKEPLKEGAPGHGCGHNIYGASGLGGAIAARMAVEAGNIKGTVNFFGTPAEETGIGKVFMVRDGFFKNVDAVMGHHIGAAHTSSLKSNNALNSAKFIFHGTSSHAGSTPWQGRSALDAVELMDAGVNSMREHVVPESRIHYVITNGGGQPNVVPAEASNWYYVRAPQRETVDHIYNWILEIAEGAAKMTKTKVEVKFQSGLYNMLPNRTLAELHIRNMKEIGAPIYTKEELEFARKIGEQISPEERRTWGYRVPGHESLPSDVYLDTRIIEPWGEGTVAGGSSDESDISWNVPFQGVNTGSRIIGAPGHHWMNVATSGMGIGHKNVIFASKVMAFSTLDLLTKPEILKKAWDEFTKRKGGREYKSPLPPDLKPPLDQFKTR